MSLLLLKTRREVRILQSQLTVTETESVTHHYTQQQLSGGRAINKPSSLGVERSGLCGSGVAVQTIMPFALAVGQEVCV
ncbi:hypothetical protein Q5P01_021480 [Channa striata]|uniref:Uncharacterized protein n=1 Tax=Channa striata TaxID=64152 RepID=A0AA88LUB9_CHASR|nr:hypothetical protein Q5P01_021480 [Channa striata]